MLWSSFIVIVILVFEISKIWSLTGVKSFCAGVISKSNVAPTKESGLKELIEMNPFEYVTVPAVLERITLSEPER